MDEYVLVKLHGSDFVHAYAGVTLLKQSSLHTYKTDQKEYSQPLVNTGLWKV